MPAADTYVTELDAKNQPQIQRVIDALTATGVDRASALLLEEKLEQGHTLISVTAANEAAASIAWHVFKHASAETIVVGHAEALAAATGSAPRESDALPALSVAA